ncbi:arrestin domain-containing protein 1a [Aulostomus maculatus]
MGKIQEFDITFDHNKVVYSPGESICGSVRVTVGQPLLCKAIKVNCNGFCGITSKANDTAWTMEEQYFSSTLSVTDKGTLKQGQHTFPFKFLIPASAPTSFEGNYGRTIYRVRAFIDTPRFAKDYNTEKVFFLLSLLNLNEIPDIWGTCSSAVTQQFTYLLVKTGTVVLKAQTDMKGYTPGQIIQLTASIHNQSVRSTGHITASLMQRVTYEMKKPIHDVKVIVEVEGGAVKAGKELEWKEQIIVPPLPQSSLTGCDLIKIEYYVKVSLKSPDVMLTLPIHIGNVSLDKKLQPSKKAAPPSSAHTEKRLLPALTLDTPAMVPSPTLPPRPVPRPAPRPTPRSRMSPQNSPSAPPAEYCQGAEGETQTRDSFNKRHSQVVSPNAFSYAPGLLFTQSQQHKGPATEPGHPGASALYPPVNTASPMSTQLILPPDYGVSAYPQEAPPSYDESCNT